MVPFVTTLSESRNRLAKEWRRPVSGTFAKAQELTRNTELWDKKIKWRLEWSKAFRSFAVVQWMVDWYAQAERDLEPR